MFDFTARRVTQSVYESLERLGVAYIDCIQVHDPEFAPSLEIVLHETLPALHRLKELGVVRHVGITGYPLGVLRQLLEQSPVPIDTCLSYCHHSLNDATLLPQLLPLLQSKGVGLINASPLSMGLLTPRGPPAWHPAHAFQKEVCREAVAYCEAQGVDVTKLALWFSLFSDERVPTTLVSTASVSKYASFEYYEYMHNCNFLPPVPDYAISPSVPFRTQKQIHTASWPTSRSLALGRSSCRARSGRSWTSSAPASSPPSSRGKRTGRAWR